MLGWSGKLRTESGFSGSRRYRRQCAAVALSATLALAPRTASAQGLFDFLFGSFQKQSHSSSPNFFADPFGLNTPAPTPPRPVASAGGGSGPAFCVRTCDGRYFPVRAAAGSTSAQMCQAFCPATATRVFFGSSIDGATSGNGERYADSDNAYAFRKEMKADCTCNGRSPAGLAPVDLTLDTSLRAGDVIATSNGLVAYSGVRVGANQTAEFTPVASYPGLTAEVRARLGEMKVAPVNAEMIADEAPLPETSREAAPTVIPVPKPSPPKAKRADLD
jgi:Protein of unknown function (DUF2865)